MPVRSKRKLPSETLSGDREIDGELEPDDLATVDSLDAPVRRQRVEQGEAATRGRVLSVVLDGGEGRAAVGDVDPDPVGKDVQRHAHWRRRVQHRVRHELGRQQGGATRDVGGQISEVRGDPVPGQRRALHDRLEVQCRHAIPCRTQRLGGYAPVGDTRVVEAQDDDVIGAFVLAQHGRERRRGSVGPAGPRNDGCRRARAGPSRR